MGAFLSKDIVRFDAIVETESLMAAVRRDPEAILIDFYTLIVIATPIVFLAFLRMAATETRGQELFFAVTGLFCLALFFSQLRLQYFGLWVLIMGPLLLVRMWLYQRNEWPLWLSGVILFVYGAAFAGPVINRLEHSWPLGLDHQYGLVRESLIYLEKACADEPGVVLAYNDVGNYVRYHTECTVVANNFLLTDQHQDKIRELDALFGMDIEQLADQRPDIKYILVAFPKLLLHQPDGRNVLLSREEMKVINADWPLMINLLLDDEYGSAQLELIHQQRIEENGDEMALVKLFRVKPTPPSEAR